MRTRASLDMRLLRKGGHAADGRVRQGGCEQAGGRLSLGQGDWQQRRQRCQQNHLAKIDDLLVGPDGKQPYAVLSIGGFLGTGIRLVVVP
jgi:hypothetical protein